MHLKLGIFLPKSKFPLPVPQLGGEFHSPVPVPQRALAPRSASVSAPGTIARCPMSDAARAVSVPALTLRIAPIIKVCFRGWEETFLEYVGAVGRLSQAAFAPFAGCSHRSGALPGSGRLGRITLRALLHRCLVERLSGRSRSGCGSGGGGGGGAVTGDGPGAAGPAEEAEPAARFADEGSDRNDGEVCGRDCGRGGNDRNDRKRGGSLASAPLQPTAGSRAPRPD